jgi:sugar phosphate isomerase/epimerase
MPIELTCTSFSFPTLSFEKSLQLIALLEIPRFDVGAHLGGGHIDPVTVEADPGAVAERIRRAAGEAGLEASDFFPTLGHGFRDRPVNAIEARVRTENATRFRAIVECAAGIGAKGITLLPGVVWPELGQARSFEQSVAALRELLPVARDRGLRLSVEAHLESVAEAPADAARLCEEVPGLQLTLDYSHFLALGYSTGDVHPLLRYAGHFHARQAAPGRLQASIKDGTLNFPDLVGRLKAGGYAGDVCIEYTWQDWRDCWRQDVVSESVILRDLIRPVLAG